MSIKVENISKKYGSQQVLDNVSFNIPSGQIVGFLGPNGAGKSTMMKIITGFIPDFTGNAEVAGINIRTAPIEAKRMIGYLPEHNPLYLDMYVKEYLLFVAKSYGMGRESAKKVDEMVQKTGLTEEYRKKIGQLSKGYRQRVGLAQALIHDPQVLILDEPTTGLDPNQVVDVRNLIIETGKEKTVMLSTHIMQEVKAICQRVMIINKGQLVADDAQSMLTETLDFVVETEQPIDEQHFSAIAGIIQISPISSNIIEIQATRDIRSDIFQTALNKGLMIKTLKQKEQNMEEVFRELTK
ncbi:MAG: gliding motility-associated ABC transporter ATP-binding subunit GldA [Prevotellaceae bacterium]|nr:gliding motility-associated ABC transporter ATP-binding subunit GldA [Prevotellaceae bacterium]